MKFHTQPRPYQRDAVEYLMPREYGALYTDMGSGKTKIMLDLIVNKGWKKVIIVCPKKVAGVWPEEINKHTPSLVSMDLTQIKAGERPGEIVKNGLEHKSNQQVIIINYESVWREPLRSFLLNKYKPDAVICDESHRIKAPGSKVSRFLHLLGKRTPNRYLMTGTPLSQSPLDIYGQYRYLEPSIFGTNFNNFKGQYSNWIQTRGGFPMLDKKNPYKNLDELYEKMFGCAFAVEVDLQLPPTQDITIEFELGPKAQKYYREIQKEGVIDLGDDGYVDAGNVLAEIIRQQQITSGYMPITTDDGVKITEIDTTRQDTLRDLFEDIPQDEPIVVFCKYRKDIKNVLKVAENVGRSAGEVSGRSDDLAEWRRGDTNVLVVQISSGAEGIDLTRAKYCVYYTLDHSLGKYLQSRKRIHRPGQDRPVIYYTIIARMKRATTIDQKIAKSLEDNENLIDSIMSGDVLL